MCSPSLNKYSSVIYVCAFAEREREREREVAKKSVWMFNECLHESSLSSSASSANEKRLFHIFSFFQPLLRLTFFFTCEGLSPEVATSLFLRSEVGHLTNIFIPERRERIGKLAHANSKTRAFLFLSLSRIEPQAKKGRRHRALSLSLSLDGVVFFALLLRLFRARREFARLEKRKRRKKKKREEEDDDYSTECDDEGREHQRGGEKDIRLRPTLG